MQLQLEAQTPRSEAQRSAVRCASAQLDARLVNLEVSFSRGDLCEALLSEPPSVRVGLVDILKLAARVPRPSMGACKLVLSPMLALALLRAVTDVPAPPALLHSAQLVAHPASLPDEQSEHLCIARNII